MDTKEKTGRVSSPPKRRSSKNVPSNQTNDAPVRKRKEKEPARPLQDVVYIPPKPFMRNRLLIRIATVAAIVLALVLAMSVFFRVEYIHVSGMEQYTAWQISEASGIKQGDSLFSLGLPGAAARIKTLPYVKNVRIGIKLPNMVMIEITEVRVTYAVQSQNDDWWLVDSGGRVIESVSGGDEASYTKILGVHIKTPEVGQEAVAHETAGFDIDAEGNTIPVVVTAAQKLNVALAIADQLEANGIIGQAASIDVTDLGNLQVWYGEQYQIKLGDESQLAHKINLAKGAIDSLSSESHNSGVLDASLTVDKTGIRYTRFQ